MKAVITRALGSTEAIELRSLQKPWTQKRRRDVLVKVYAAAVNMTDVRRRKGEIERRRPPFVLGTAFAGVVQNVSPTVKRWRPGDEVYGFLNWRSPYGSCAEYIVGWENSIARKPQNLSFTEAATLPLEGTIAYRALKTDARLSAGQSVLILGGHRGVGLLAVQMAKAFGASKVYTTCSRQHKALLHAVGADYTFDIASEDFAEILQYTRVDVVFDCEGRRSDRARAASVLRKGGRLVSVSWTEPNEFSHTWANLWHFAKEASRYAISYGVWTKYRSSACKPNSIVLTEITKLVEAGKLRPVIWTTLPLEMTKSAHEMMESPQSFGSIAIQIATEPLLLREAKPLAQSSS